MAVAVEGTVRALLITEDNMNIEQIAEQVARDFKMGFDGIELDFALEVAKRAVEAEREACAVIAETPVSGEQDDITMGAKDRVAAAIRARSNANVCGLPHGKEDK